MVNFEFWIALEWNTYKHENDTQINFATLDWIRNSDLNWKFKFGENGAVSLLYLLLFSDRSDK